MIECLDQGHASKVFAEMAQVQEMGQHRQFCNIVDCFTHWDKQLTSMFLCIVAPFIEGENLASFLIDMDRRSLVLDEEVVRRWLTEIIEAMSFAHSRKICHRDLHPNNLYIHPSTKSIIIGDICPPGVLADMLSHQRGIPGCRRWSAPELARELTSDERADVWSVGRIALSMILTGIPENENSEDKLEKIRYSPEALDRILNLACEYFHEETLLFIRSMLCLDPDDRPSFSDLMKEHFVAVGMREISAARVEQQTHDFPYQPVPIGAPLSEYVRYIRDNIDNETCIGDVFEYLIPTMQRSKTDSVQLDDVMSINESVLHAMVAHMHVEQIVFLGLGVLNVQLSENSDKRKIMNYERAVEIVLEGVRRHSTSTKVQVAALSALLALATNAEATERVRQMKGAEDIVKVLCLCVADASICATCLKVLWRLMATGGRVRTLVDKNVLEDVAEVMKIHKFDGNVMEAAFAVIFGMTLPEENLKIINALGFRELIVDGLDRHRNVAKLVKNGFLALAALVEADMESAYEMVTQTTSSEPLHSLQKVMEIYHYQKNDYDAVLALCTLLCKLSQYEDIASEMDFLQIGEILLSEILRNYPDSQEISSRCKKISTNMRNVKPLLPITVELARVEL